jgi:dUTPase
MKLQIQFTSKAARVHYSRESAYGSAFAAGMDLRAAIDAPMTILPSEQAFISELDSGLSKRVGY